MTGHTHVFGRKPTVREREKDRERERKGKRPLKVDTFLSAPDLLARHLLVRRDSAVPGKPTGQGVKKPWTKSNFKNIKAQSLLQDLIKPAPNFYLFHPSSDAPFQRRCSHSQWSGPLQGDGPKARGCDRPGEPFPFLVPWPSCDSSSSACTYAALAGWCLHHLLPFRTGGQAGGAEAVPGVHWGNFEVPSSSCRYFVTGEMDRRWMWVNSEVCLTLSNL